MPDVSEVLAPKSDQLDNIKPRAYLEWVREEHVRPRLEMPDPG